MMGQKLKDSREKWKMYKYCPRMLNTNFIYLTTATNSKWVPLQEIIRSMLVSEQLHIYPFPNPTLTLQV